MTTMKAGAVHKTFMVKLTNLIYRKSGKPLVSQKQSPKLSRFVEYCFETKVPQEVSESQKHPWANSFQESPCCLRVPLLRAHWDP